VRVEGECKAGASRISVILQFSVASSYGRSVLETVFVTDFSFLCGFGVISAKLLLASFLCWL
jgi:hypothetical protein